MKVYVPPDEAKALLNLIDEMEDTIHWHARRFLRAKDVWEKTDALQEIIDAMDAADMELEELEIQVTSTQEAQGIEDDDEVHSQSHRNPLLYELFQRFYAVHAMGDPPEAAVIVFSEDSFDIPPADVKMRSYRVVSDEPIFHGDPDERTMYGTCLADPTQRVRLDTRLFDQRRPWKVEDIYYSPDDAGRT